MNSEIIYQTDTATLALFDPMVLKHRTQNEGTWWGGPFHQILEVRDGRIALVSLGSDGVYKLRITNAELTPAEKIYASELIVLGIEVQSGNLFVGAGEHLPGEGLQPNLNSEEKCFFLPHSNGMFDAEIYLIDWYDSPDWYTEAGEKVPDDAPPDLVVCIRPRSRFLSPEKEPRFEMLGDHWLFPELQRRLGPRLGMEFTTVVVNRKGTLILKPCGPCRYRPILSDMTGLDWHDRIRVKVISVMDDRKEMSVQVTEKLIN